MTAVQVRSDEVPVKGNGRQLTLLSSYCVPAMMLCDLHLSCFNAQSSHLGITTHVTDEETESDAIRKIEEIRLLSEGIDRLLITEPLWSGIWSQLEVPII